MTNLDPNHFHSKLRNIFWPIHNHELGKFIPISALMFCILFNQNILRILKDSILISEISVEITSFTKVYCVTPIAAIFVVAYAKMVNTLTFEKIFYNLISIFTGFYILFAFIVYPNIHMFHMDATYMQELSAIYPNFKWYIALVGNWSYVLFYTFSELWPNIFYVLLFWQFANEVTSTNEAKRFYTLFSLFGNSSLILVGVIMLQISDLDGVVQQFFSASDSKILLSQLATSMVAVSSVISCFLVRYMSKNILTNQEFYAKAKAERSTKAGMGIIESFRYIARSRYLWLMLICTASFGLSMNLVEAVWKSKINELYPTVNEYASFNSLYILWTGVVIMIMTIIGNNLMRSHSWFVSAIITPVIILVTGSAFFFLVVFDQQIVNLFEGIILISPLALAVFIGTVQNVLSKGAKYSILDTSREMLYIPLDKELKTKGKAAVDVISPKVGKASSGLVQSVIFTLAPTATYSSIAPVLMVVFVGVCITWIYAVWKVYLEYQKIVN